METERRIIAMGFFDGVHLGHRALLEATKKLAVKTGATPSVISFDSPPKYTVTGNFVPLINTPYDRADIVKRYIGIDDMIFLHFDEELMRMSWEQFLDWMINDFGACGFVAGYDFTFGYRGEGNAEKLREKCEKLGIPCDIITKVTAGETTISSTYIRELIINGQMAKAVQLMGHPHVLTEVVRYGYRFGRKLGFPTINMKVPDGVICPCRGVYAAKVYLPDEGEFLAVTNVGVRPTVGGADDISVESHILDYDGNLYGKRVRVEFYEYLREEVKFDKTEELKEQIAKDIAKTRSLLTLD